MGGDCAIKCLRQAPATINTAAPRAKSGEAGPGAHTAPHRTGSSVTAEGRVIDKRYRCNPLPVQNTGNTSALPHPLYSNRN